MNTDYSIENVFRMKQIGPAITQPLQAIGTISVENEAGDKNEAKFYLRMEQVESNGSYYTINWENARVSLYQVSDSDTYSLQNAKNIIKFNENTQEFYFQEGTITEYTIANDDIDPVWTVKKDAVIKFINGLSDTGDSSNAACIYIVQ